jgi:hypothetical protein
MTTARFVQRHGRNYPILQKLTQFSRRSLLVSRAHQVDQHVHCHRLPQIDTHCRELPHVDEHCAVPKRAVARPVQWQCPNESLVRGEVSPQFEQVDLSAALV